MKIEKLLCFFGIHKWSGKKYKSGWKWIRFWPLTGFDWKRQCVRCKTIQRVCGKSTRPIKKLGLEGGGE